MNAPGPNQSAGSRAVRGLSGPAATPWPDWPVPAGELTPRGYRLMTIMGRYYRVLYGGSGLVESNICPPLRS